MFKGIQDLVKPKKKIVPPLRPDLLPVLKASQLLESEKRRANLRRLPSLLGLSDANYALLAEELIHRFAEFVQDIPETRNSYYAKAGGLLDHSLDRTVSTLQFCRSYFLPRGGEAAALTQPQTLWTYAVFSASLLHGIGKLATDYVIEVFDAKQQQQRLWSAFDGSFSEQGRYYKYDFKTSYQERFKTRVSLLLARQIMPIEGFRWISQNSEVLAVWLALIDDDLFEAGTFGAVHHRADAQVILRYFEALRGADASQGSKFAVFATPEGSDAVGLDFLAWLKAGLADGSLKVGESVAVAKEGLVIPAELFDAYVKDVATKQTGSKETSALTAQAVTDSFLRLNVHHLAVGGVAAQTVTQFGSNLRLQGYILTKLDLAMPQHLMTSETLKVNAYLQQSLVTGEQFIAPNGTLVNQTVAKPTAAPSPTMF
jgi:integrating conjugative element relaxase (TIGR03760 family)